MTGHEAPVVELARLGELPNEGFARSRSNPDGVALVLLHVGLRPHGTGMLLEIRHRPEREAMDVPAGILHAEANGFILPYGDLAGLVAQMVVHFQVDGARDAGRITLAAKGGGLVRGRGQGPADQEQRYGDQRGSNSQLPFPERARPDGMPARLCAYWESAHEHIAKFRGFVE